MTEEDTRSIESEPEDNRHWIMKWVSRNQIVTSVLTFTTLCTTWMFGHRVWSWFQPAKLKQNKSNPFNKHQKWYIPTAAALSGAAGTLLCSKMHYGPQIKALETENAELVEQAKKARPKGMSLFREPEEEPSWTESFFAEWGFLISTGLTGIILLLLVALSVQQESNEKDREVPDEQFIDIERMSVGEPVDIVVE